MWYNHSSPEKGDQGKYSSKKVKEQFKETVQRTVHMSHTYGYKSTEEKNEA